jgi:dihydroxyacetone kinase
VASSSTLTSALTHALNRLYTYTRARPPSRTLIDPLAAFVEAISADASSQGIKIAVQKAGEAAERTRDLEAKAGRSAYVEGELLKKERVADPGAWGVKTVLESLFV